MQVAKIFFQTVFQAASLFFIGICMRSFSDEFVVFNTNKKIVVTITA